MYIIKYIYIYICVCICLVNVTLFDVWRNPYTQHFALSEYLFDDITNSYLGI